MTYVPFIMPVLLIIVNIFRITVGKKSEAILISIITLVFSLIVGLRDENAGHDTINYVTLFNEISSLDDIFHGYMSWKGDYFFSFIVYLIKTITENYQIFLFAMALFSISLLNIGLYRLFKYQNKKNIVLPIALFYMTISPYILYSNTIRQGLAISLVILGLSFYNRILIFFIIILFALLTHKSALLFILFPFIFNFLNSNKNKFLYFFVMLFLAKNIILNLPFNIPYVSSKLSYYSNSFIEVENGIKILLFSSIFILLINKNFSDKIIRTNVLFNYFIFVGSISLLSTEYSKASARYILYLSPVTPFMLLYFMEYYREKKFIKSCTILFFYIMSFLSLFLKAVQTNLSYNY